MFLDNLRFSVNSLYTKDRFEVIDVLCYTVAPGPTSEVLNWVSLVERLSLSSANQRFHGRGCNLIGGKTDWCMHCLVVS